MSASKQLGRHWALYEYVPAVAVDDGARASSPQRAAGAAGRRSAKRVSNWIVMALMVATTSVALFDLYLLGTGLPR
jgi:hypothetical protein